MATKRAIPPVPKSSAGTDRQPFDVALKDVVETITGVRGGKVAALPAGASLADVVAKVNEIIAALQ